MSQAAEWQSTVSHSHCCCDCYQISSVERSQRHVQWLTLMRLVHWQHTAKQMCKGSLKISYKMRK